MNLLREDSVDVVPHAVAGIENLGLVGERELAEPGHARADREDLPVVLLEQADEFRILGRGPTRLIWPRRTFQSCGSSSSFVRARSSTDAGEAWVDVTGEGMPGRSVVHLPELEDQRGCARAIRRGSRGRRRVRGTRP